MDLTAKSKIANEEPSEHHQMNPAADPASNVYSFGIMLLEIISGKVPYNEEQGSLVNWVKSKYSSLQLLLVFLVGLSDVDCI